jgi:hypothetical protein
VNINVTTTESVEETEHAETTEITEKSVRAIRAAEIFISTSSEEATKLPKLSIIPLIKKKSVCVINAIKHNITAYVGNLQM